MTKTERNELEEISLKAFGSKTRYKKLMDRGRTNDLVDETGRKYVGIERFDVEQVRKVMADEIERKAKEAEDKLKAEQKDKELASGRIESPTNIIESTTNS